LSDVIGVRHLRSLAAHDYSQIATTEAAAVASFLGPAAPPAALPLKYPITGITGSCARATSGQATRKEARDELQPSHQPSSG
jgi:hypothetical protein